MIYQGSVVSNNVHPLLVQTVSEMITYPAYSHTILLSSISLYTLNFHFEGPYTGVVKHRNGCVDMNLVQYHAVNGTSLSHT